MWLTREDLESVVQDQARKRINQLAIRVLYHRYRYYVLSDPAISDRAYDRLERGLRKLEKEYPKFRWRSSPTKTVGSEIPESYPDLVRSLVTYAMENRL